MNAALCSNETTNETVMQTKSMSLLQQQRSLKAPQEERRPSLHLRVVSN